jgi:hypothetical protein
VTTVMYTCGPTLTNTELFCAVTFCPLLWPHRRKSPYTPRFNPLSAPKGPPKKGNYWDNVDWDAPLQSFVPDKWYIRVAWAILLLGVTWYVNAYYGAAGAAASSRIIIGG